MNPTSIEYLTHTWNPWVGCSGEGCEVRDVCWARKQARRQKPSDKKRGCWDCYHFRPHAHPERLIQPINRKKPAVIGVCFSGDLFRPEVPSHYIRRVISVARQCPQHVFVFLTKNPKRYEEFDFPRNCWLGTTVNKQADVHRVNDLVESWNNNGNVKFVSFEPLLEKVILPEDANLDWIIVGAQTRPRIIPEDEWVESIIKQAGEMGAALFFKDNLEWPDTVREMPKNRMDGICRTCTKRGYCKFIKPDEKAVITKCTWYEEEIDPKEEEQVTRGQSPLPPGRGL